MKIAKISFFLLLIAFFGSCSRMVGDPCSSSADCSTGQICDKTLPGGYCTKSDCHFFGCPSESSCVAFNDFDNYCMILCSDETDCRENYTCVTDFGDQAFCGAIVEGSP